jgi:DMSO/TMAO reductase YedYZ molybdopterin-dependent catalytic subunit
LATWGWDEFGALPQTEIKADIHCVTKWSKLDTNWRGVSFDDLLQAAGLETAPTGFLMAHCDGGYTTNVPVADLVGDKGMIATHFGELPLTPTHGGPARLLVPHLYFWKSAKWVRELRFMKRTSPASGNRSDTISTATRGVSNAIGAIRDRQLPAPAMADGDGRRQFARKRPAQPASASPFQTGRGIGPASTWICGSPRPTATRLSAAIRSRRLPERTASRSRSSGSPMAKSRLFFWTRWWSGILLSFVGRLAAILPGRRARVARCSSSPAAREWRR